MPNQNSLLSSAQEKEPDKLTKLDQVNILLAEYTRLSSHARSYVEHFSQKFTLFGLFVLSAFAFALQNPAYQVIYIMIPFFVFFIGFVTTSQVYIITVLSGRLKIIEKRIKDLNGGNYILEWENRVAPKYVFTFLIKVRTKGRKGSEITIPNPTVIAVIFMLLPAQPLIIYSSWRAYSIVPSPWNLVYILVVTISDIVMILQSFYFYIFGQISEDS